MGVLHFKSLRLTGFKSFADKTELDIAPGLTGVVGPNGCGKSNLVEALRWVMGESSAKKMRGGEMEDVIFAGSERRSGRSIAEVGITLDNSDRGAPASYNNTDEIEVTRKIVKDQGSAYRINGRPARARDVQMLFADTLSGANSPALVSQGRVTAMINAKPMERRVILEESAGISGVYARRHEAELRLKAADQNMARLQDLVGSYDQRLLALKKQARIALRYRGLSEDIRKLDIEIAVIEWLIAGKRYKDAETTFNAAESEVREALTTVTQLGSTLSTLQKDLPALQQEEAKTAAGLQHVRVALDKLDGEDTQIATTIEELTRQQQQLATDEAHDRQTLEENETLKTRITREEETLQKDQVEADSKIKELESKVASAAEHLAGQETQYQSALARQAEDTASRHALEQEKARSYQAVAEQERRYASAKARLEQLKERAVSLPDLENTQNGLAALVNKIDALEKEITADQDQAEQLTTTGEQTEQASHTAEKALSALLSDIRALEAIVAPFAQEIESAILRNVQPDKGYEKALSRALGEALNAAEGEEDKDSFWRKLTKPDTTSSLPTGARPLDKHIKSPAILDLALSQIGVVDSVAAGTSLQKELKVGQALVTTEGDYWRWDGYCVRANAADRNSVFLEQQNQLETLNGQRPAAEKKVEEAKAKHSKVKAEIDTLRTALRDKTGALQSLQRDKSRLEADVNNAARAHDLLNAENTAATEALKQIEQDLAAAQKTLKEAEAVLNPADQGAQETLRQAVEDTSRSLAEAREAHGDVTRLLDRAMQSKGTREARLHAIADERISLQNRTIRARERLATLEDRQKAATQKLTALKIRPKEIKTERESLLSRQSEVESGWKKASETLNVRTTEIGDTNRALREAESRLADLRERRAHATATVDGLLEQKEAAAAIIREKFDLSPEQLYAKSGLAAAVESENLPDLSDMKERRARAIYDRDALGPVNLQAEQDMQAIEGELGTLIEERADLEQAIAELREGISTLNKEARERLGNTFKLVNAHFGALFRKLYGGGEAYLAFTESEDPLTAGLEIFAQPPGKTLQSLTLLSGGEQTLASIALIFAMFLTNPAPICVLDEIDAPLDDSNVDRVCDLLDEIAESTKTRFLIITHHRLTMARMDRLYGVTMPERGISQLVSVDLQQTFEFMEAA